MGELVLLTRLVLAHNRLSGTLPDFSNCSFLATLDLSHNRLSGAINFATLVPTRLAPPFPIPKPSVSSSSSHATAAAAGAQQVTKGG